MPLAVVSGGGTGIGLAIADALAADGYDLALIGRRVHVLRDAAQKLSADHRAAVAVLPGGRRRPRPGSPDASVRWMCW